MTKTTAIEPTKNGEPPISTPSLYYAELLSWPTTIDPETGEVRLRLGETVDALVMQAGLGGEVNHELVRAMMRVPIIAARRDKATDWIFLTQPRTPMRQLTIADVIAAQVGWYKTGSTMVLPAFGTAESALRWLQQPETDVDLPSWGAVIGAIRRTATSAW